MAQRDTKGTFEHEVPSDAACGALPHRTRKARRRSRFFRALLTASANSAPQGLATQFVQINNSLSAKKGTLRGMHYQLAPAAEVKMVRCLQRRVVGLPLLISGPDSPTFGKWFGAELNDENR